MRDWGKHAHGSPLYAHLVEVISNDPELLSVVDRIEHSPPPNLLFAGVHYLVMTAGDPDLVEFYASMVEHPRPPLEADEPFRRFVLEHQEDLIHLGRTRYTQTNECRRCVALLPMVWVAPFDRFHLVDLGTSAGLNLAIDKYRYAWDGLTWGPPGGVRLETESRGAAPSIGSVQILSRVGLDLHPVDPKSGDQKLWLDALIWPEHHQRRLRLRAALDQVSQLPLRLIPGDLLDTLTGVLDHLPAGEPVVVMNSFALNQLSDDRIAVLQETVREARQRRPIHRVSMEIPGQELWARMIVDDGSGPRDVGSAHPHGEWIDLSEDYARP